MVSKSIGLMRGEIDHFGGDAFGGKLRRRRQASPSPARPR